jgi:3-deoxy-7-phosphoheptulonate synthase
MVEVHLDPKRALSDGQQAILPAAFARLMEDLRQLAPIVERELSLYARSSS